MSITYSLVKAHAGEITFKSKLKEGTIFSVLLPAITEDKAFKILIVDDNEMIRNLLRDALVMDKSYLVDTASNGIEACIKLGSYRPDLLILDIFMPQMDGLEVCRTMKKNPDLSDIKVIITTGFSNNPKIKEVAELGFDNIYLKPFKLKEFLKKINDILIV